MTLVQSFELKIYPGANLEAEPAYEASGDGQSWMDHAYVRLPGFDSYISLDLNEFWQTAIEGQHRQYQDSVTGLETIHKFGEQTQLRENFTAVVSINYAE